MEQNGEPLEKEGVEWRVPSLAGRLDLRYRDSAEEKFPLFKGEPLIFKMRKDWQGEGRRATRISQGHFIVIAPKDWERTGKASVAPEACVDPDFKAHFFHQDEGAASQEAGGFRESGPLPTDTAFQLTGVRVFDDSDHGDLFVGAVPELEALSHIAYVRVGEERKDGWKGENFRPGKRSLADALRGKQGRFFVRVYDSDSKLVDSEAFRYLRDLGEIRVNGEPYRRDSLLAPSVEGHLPTTVRFADMNGAPTCPDIEAVCRQEADRLCHTLEAGGGRVEVELDLPRIW